MAFITATPAKRPPEAQFSQLHFGTPRAAPASTLCFTAHRPQPIAADFMLLCAPAPFFFLKLTRSAFHPTLHYHQLLSALGPLKIDAWVRDSVFAIDTSRESA